MSDPPRPRQTGSAIEPLGPQSIEQMKRSARLKVRAALRIAKIAAWMAGAAVVIPVAMITGGVLLGPRGYEGIILAPTAVLAAWGVILWLGLRGRSTPRRIQRADVRELPARVAEWLEAQRPRLPAGAQSSASHLAETLEALDVQVQALPAEAAAARSLRKLLVDELTPLVDGYRKLPPNLQRAPLHGGASPEQRLVEGLSTLDAELRRMRDALAQDDLNSLATHQRYLELKYRDDE